MALSKTRIALLVGQLGFGGTERQLYLLLKHIDRRKFEPHVLVFSGSRGPDYRTKFEEMKIQATLIPDSCRSIGGRLRYVHRYLKKIRPHLVHSWTVHDNAYAGVGGAMAGVRHRWGSARISLHSSGFKNLPLAFRWLAIHAVQRIVVNARSIASQVEAAGFSPRKITFIPNCVERFSGPRTLPHIFVERGIEPSQPIVATVANYRRSKNLVSFVKVMKRVIDRLPDVRGVLAGQRVSGDNEVWTEVEREISTLDLKNRVHMIGYCEDVSAMLSHVSVLCSTSVHEGTPNAVLEAMEVGVPVVCPAIDGVVDLVSHETCGLLYEPGDEERAADLIVSLVENNALRVSIIAAAQERVRAEFSCSTTTAKFEQLYGSVHMLQGNSAVSQ